MKFDEAPTEILHKIFSITANASEQRTKNMGSLVGVCKRFNAVGREHMYRHAVLSVKEPRADEEFCHRALTPQLQLLDLVPDIGYTIQSLSFSGLSTDLIPSFARCSIMTERSFVDFCARAPNMTACTLHKCIWDDVPMEVPEVSFPALTSLALTQAASLCSQPFPFTVLRHTPLLKSFTFSTAPGSGTDIRACAALQQCTMAVDTFVFLPSYPFPADLLDAMLTAMAPTLRDLTVYLPLVRLPPNYDSPNHISLLHLEELESFCAVLPIHMLPIFAITSDTWDYFLDMAATTAPSLRRLRLELDFGNVERDRSMIKFVSLPAHFLETLIAALPEAVDITIAIRANASARVPSWEELFNCFPDWTAFRARERVTLEASNRDTDDNLFLHPDPTVTPNFLSDDEFLDWYTNAGLVYED